MSIEEALSKIDEIRAELNESLWPNNEPSTSFVAKKLLELTGIVRVFCVIATKASYEHGECKCCGGEGRELHDCPYYSATEQCNCCRDCTSNCSMAN